MDSIAFSSVAVRNVKTSFIFERSSQTETSRCACSKNICNPWIRLRDQRSAMARPWKQKRGWSTLLARKDESRYRMSVRDELAGHKVMLTVAILSATALNFSNAVRNEEIQSTRTIGLSSANATLWIGAAIVLISELAFFAASRAASTVKMSWVLSLWVGPVSWFIDKYSG